MSLHPEIAAVLAGESEGCIVTGDCLEIMADMPENSIDTIVTDPPYGLKFMGKEWDHGVPGVPFWTEALRVAKPGAMLMAFGGTRTFHRLACAIEDAGWEIRDTLMWVYGSGFPKSHDVSKAIDKAAGAEREVVGRAVSQGGRSGSTSSVGQHLIDAGRDFDITAPATDAAKLWEGWGTALKPAWEPIILAMKPLDGTFAQNAEKWGVAGLWIDGGRICGKWTTWRRKDGSIAEGGCMPFAAQEHSRNPEHPSGRWPANLILSYPEDEYDDEGSLLPNPGKDEVLAGFPMTDGGAARKGHPGGKTFGGGKMGDDVVGTWYGDSGSAARFFYCAKASRSERTCNGKVENRHPTVKPVKLMEYLCKLTRTPTGGVVLDPFCGSGTTCMAAKKLGRRWIGIEIDPEYAKTARQRVRDTPRPLFTEEAQTAPADASLPFGEQT